MNGAERRARMLFHAVNRVVALAVSACLLVLLGVGIDGVPALGRALVPGHGAWRSPSAKGLSAAAAERRVRFPGAQPRAVVRRAAFVSTAGDPALELGGSDHSRLYSDLLSGWQTETCLPIPAADAAAAASHLAIGWEHRP
jgi:hypothetical protein